MQHASFARVSGNEIENQAVLLLAVTVDAAHALFQPHWIPGNVVVNHEPAELQVYAFPGGFRSHEHLGGLAEFALGPDSGVRRVAVTNFHGAVDLGHTQAPLHQFAQRPAFPSITRQKIERVLMLGEDEQLHLRVFEDTVIGDQFAQLDQLGFDFSFFQPPCLIDQLSQFEDFFPERSGVIGHNQLLQLVDDLLSLGLR